MKTNILYSAIFALIISSILSSCAFMQKGEFAQRKYYNFPRTNHSVNAEKMDYTAYNHQKENSQSIAAEEKAKTTEPIITASVGEKIILISKHHAEPDSKKITAEKNQSEITFNSISNDNSVFTLKKSEIRELVKQNNSNSKNTDAGTMLFIMIIAAIFFPFL